MANETQSEQAAHVDEADADPATMAKALEKAKKRGAITADLMTRPSFMAAHTAMSFIPDSMKAYGEPNIVPMYEEFQTRVKGVCEGDMTTPEALLAAQAMSLNSIYNECAQLAGLNIANRLPQAEVLLRMALKAQAQCTQALRILSELKNPRQATFIKQQNNAHQQQVNNGTAAAVPHARTEKDIGTMTTEVLTDEREAQHAATLDTGATTGAGRENQTLEAVGGGNRAGD